MSAGDHDGACPCCGYCRHCGRGPSWPYYVWPYYQPYFQPTPPSAGGTWIGSGVQPLTVGVPQHTWTVTNAQPNDIVYASHSGGAQ